MPNTEKQYYIYQDNQKIEVNKETYQTYYRPIWQTYKEKLRRGECSLTDWRKCKGDCGVCAYLRDGKTISLESSLLNDSEDSFSFIDTLKDPKPQPETVLENAELIDSLYTSLNALEQYEQDICKLYMSGLSERDIATILDIPRSTFKYRWKKILEKLSENLKNFL